LLNEMNKTLKIYSDHIENYRFDLAVQSIYEFVWEIYCDWYIEFCKTRLQDENLSISKKSEILNSLVNSLESILVALHPVIPFITEEIWQQTKNLHKCKEKSISLRNFPKIISSKRSFQDIELLKNSIVGIRNLRAEMQLSPKIKIDLILTKKNKTYNILNKYKIFQNCPESIKNLLNRGAENSDMETPKEFDNNTTEIISSNIVFRKTLAALAEAKDFNVVSLNETFEGLAIDDAELLYDKVTNTNKPNTIIISGGETLVNLTGDGLGGRNQEFALSFLRKYIKENSKQELCLYSVGTDGIDGPTDAAGAIVDSETIREYQSSDLNLESYLSNNDSYNFFRKLNALIKTGATGTNVADIQITIIE